MNVKDIDLNLLTVFDAVLAEGGISRAGERLDLSQPAVSNALARLRKATGDRLFVRLAGGMAPTHTRSASPARYARRSPASATRCRKARASTPLPRNAASVST
jgi:DNA-binding transcriptional LysR family regulator